MRKKVHESLETKLTKANNLFELLSNCPKNETIGDNLVKAWSKINSGLYRTISCSISGGSDSDIMLDICWRCDKDNKIKFSLLSNYLNFCIHNVHMPQSRFSHSVQTTYAYDGQKCIRAYMYQKIPFVPLSQGNLTSAA